MEPSASSEHTDVDYEGPLISKESKEAAMTFAWLFFFSILMFTLPFITYFGIQHVLTDIYPHDGFAKTVWSVIASVVVVNLIIVAYCYKAYYDSFDADGNSLDKENSDEPTQSDRSSLNLKQD